MTISEDSIVEFTHTLSLSDSQIVLQFLEIRGRTGSGMRSAYKSILTQFFRFVNKPSLLDINIDDCEAYFSYLDSQKYKYGTKKTRRSNINTFFIYFQRKIRRTYPTYQNPVPTLDECNFSAEKCLSVEEQEKKDDELVFSISQIMEILLGTRYMQSKYFFITLLLTFCGMRISECVSIRIENVNIKERFLMTGIEENCRKSNRLGNTPLYFCFPPKIATMLQEYILELKTEDPSNPWLFPGRFEKYCCTASYYKLLRNCFNFIAKSHTFRRTLETFQISEPNNVPLHIVEVLSNHAVSSIVMKNYKITKIAERRDLYDKYLPCEYTEILAFLERL